MLSCIITSWLYRSFCFLWEFLRWFLTSQNDLWHTTCAFFFFCRTQSLAVLSHRKLPCVQPIITGEILKDWRWLRRPPSRVSLASTQPVATLALSLSLLASLLTSRLDVWNHWGSSCHLTTIRNSLAADERWSRTLTGCYCWRCVTSICCVGRHRLTWLQVRQLTAVTVPSSSG